MYPEYEPLPESTLTPEGEFIWYTSKLITTVGFIEAALHNEAHDYNRIGIALLGVALSTTAAYLNHQWNQRKIT